MALNKVKLQNILMIVFSVLLTACAHHTPAPVVDLYQTEAKLQQRIAEAKKRLSKKQSRQLYHSPSEKLAMNTGNISQFVIEQPPKIKPIEIESDNKRAGSTKVFKKKKASKSALKPKTTAYLVKNGDTLYSIARKFSVDVKTLNKINGIKANRIYPGQKLKLSNGENTYFDSSDIRLALNKKILKQPVDTNIGSSKTRVTTKQSRSDKQAKPQNRRLAQGTGNKATQKVSKKSTNLPPRAPQTDYVNTPSKRLSWIWPTDGRVLSGFSSKGNASRGLDIAGKRGQPVRATAPGKVVYRGSGLKGYGNLVIIKHNNDFLSAYAHNEKVLVAENEFVKAGQRIADIGHSGAQQDKLHFQIRYKGKPVNPLKYLPRK